MVVSLLPKYEQTAVLTYHDPGQGCRIEKDVERTTVFSPIIQCEGGRVFEGLFGCCVHPVAKAHR